MKRTSQRVQKSVGYQEKMSSSESEEDSVSLDTLSDGDLRAIAGNPKYNALLLELLRVSRLTPELTTQEITETGATGLTPPPELTQQSSVTEEPPTKAGKRKPKGGENEPDPKRTKSDPMSEASTSKCFDPVLAGYDQDEYHFQPHKVIKEYLEKHFRRSLTKKERKAMLKADPECDAATTPEQY